MGRQKVFKVVGKSLNSSKENKRDTKPIILCFQFDDDNDDDR